MKFKNNTIDIIFYYFTYPNIYIIYVHPTCSSLTFNLAIRKIRICYKENLKYFITIVYNFFV
nr:MAG TPA: hypothetical protein [Caudoviricetes sp.]